MRETMKLMATVAFGGDFGDPKFTHDPENDIQLDVDAAATELQQAGYEVFRMPEKYRGRLAHPRDDFIEAVIAGPDDDVVIDAMMDEVQAIVRKYGGSCYEGGPVERDYVPFADVFPD